MDVLLNLLYLSFEFVKTGLFAVGGGIATIPFLKEIAQNYDWFSVGELTDMIAVSESTPGAIGINMSTYAGFKVDGLVGAAVSTISIIIPPIIVILIVSKILQKFKSNEYVKRIFYALRPASTGLVLGAMTDIFIISFFFREKFNDFSFSFFSLFGLVNWRNVLFFAIVYFGFVKFKKLHPVVFIALGAVFGAIFGV